MGVALELGGTGEEREEESSALQCVISDVTICSRKVILVPSSKTHVTPMPFRQGMNSLACLEYDFALPLKARGQPHFIFPGQFWPFLWSAPSLNGFEIVTAHSTINIQATVYKLTDLEWMS